jgi:hypothetical protein
MAKTDKWRNETEPIALPKCYRAIIVKFAQALDQEIFTPAQAESLLFGGSTPPPDNMATATTETTEKKKRHWIPNPEGKGLGNDKKWQNPTKTIRVPEAHKSLMSRLAMAIDKGDVTPEQVEALLSGGDVAPVPAPSPPLKLTPDQLDTDDYQPHHGTEPGDSRLTIAHSLLGQPQTLKGVEGGAIALTDLVLSRPKDDKQAAMAKELNDALSTIKRGRAAAVVKLSRRLAKMVLGWDE